MPRGLSLGNFQLQAHSIHVNPHMHTCILVFLGSLAYCAYGRSSALLKIRFFSVRVEYPSMTFRLSSALLAWLRRVRFQKRAKTTLENYYVACVVSCRVLWSVRPVRHSYNLTSKKGYKRLETCHKEHLTTMRTYKLCNRCGGRLISESGYGMQQSRSYCKLNSMWLHVNSLPWLKF